MGLVAGLLTAGRTLLGLGGSAVARVGTSTLGQAAIGTGIGLGAASLFTGGGAAPAAGGALATIAAAGGQPIAQLAGGRVMAMAPDGSIATFTADGKIVKPTRIIMAGDKMPPGSRIVSISADKTRIGITIRRRRRRFGAEIQRVRNTIVAARGLMDICRPPPKRKPTV